MLVQVSPVASSGAGHLGRWPPRRPNVQGKLSSPGSELVQPHIFLRSLKTTWAAFRPAAPMTPPPGTKAVLRGPPERDRAGLADSSRNPEQLLPCRAFQELPHSAGGEQAGCGHTGLLSHTASSLASTGSHLAVWQVMLKCKNQEWAGDSALYGSLAHIPERASPGDDNHNEVT